MLMFWSKGGTIMWVRNLYAGPGGGLYAGPGGGLYAGPGGGLYAGPSGGLYAGPDSSPYMATHPAWHIFAKELRRIGRIHEATIIEDALRRVGVNI